MAPTKEELVRLYLEERLSIRECAERLGLPSGSILKWFRVHAVPLRSKSDALQTRFDRDPKILESFLRRGERTRFRLGHKWSPEIEAKRAAAIRGYKHTDAWKAHHSKIHRGQRWTLEQRMRHWPKLRAARKIRPTSIERKFQGIVERYNLPYEYVGDLRCFIAGRCPDFIDRARHRVVEVFGRWWHDPQAGNPNYRVDNSEEATVEHFEKYGWTCIVIWEEMLADEPALLQKVV